jgi:hypothetical protein
MREAILGFKVNTGSQSARSFHSLPKIRHNDLFPSLLLLAGLFFSNSTALKANDFLLSVVGLAVMTCDPSLYHAGQTTAQSSAYETYLT